MDPHAAMIAAVLRDGLTQVGKHLDHIRGVPAIDAERRATEALVKRLIAGLESEQIDAVAFRAIADAVEPVADDGDPWVSDLAALLSGLDVVNTEAALDFLDVPTHRRDGKARRRVANALRELGFESVTLPRGPDGTRARAWRRA